jgi:hypothetical protein
MAAASASSPPAALDPDEELLVHSHEKCERLESGQRRFEREHGSCARFDVRYVVIGALCGGLGGVLLGIAATDVTTPARTISMGSGAGVVTQTIPAATAEVPMGKMLAGLIHGAVWGGATVALAVFALAARAADAAAGRRHVRMLRDARDGSADGAYEYVYYDAAEQRDCLYKAACCPAYGKVTTKRILYSDGAPGGCGPCCGLRGRDLETMDYERIFDVTVQQRGACDALLDSGTLVLHVSGGDLSSLKHDHRLMFTAYARAKKKCAKLLRRPAVPPVVSEQPTAAAAGASGGGGSKVVPTSDAAEDSATTPGGADTLEGGGAYEETKAGNDDDEAAAAAGGGDAAEPKAEAKEGADKKAVQPVADEKKAAAEKAPAATAAEEEAAGGKADEQKAADAAAKAKAKEEADAAKAKAKEEADEKKAADAAAKAKAKEEAAAAKAKAKEEKQQAKAAAATAKAKAKEQAAAAKAATAGVPKPRFTPADLALLEREEQSLRQVLRQAEVQHPAPLTEPELAPVQEAFDAMRGAVLELAGELQAARGAAEPAVIALDGGGGGGAAGTAKGAGVGEVCVHNVRQPYRVMDDISFRLGQQQAAAGGGGAA